VRRTPGGRRPRRNRYFRVPAAAGRVPAAVNRAHGAVGRVPAAVSRARGVVSRANGGRRRAWRTRPLKCGGRLKSAPSRTANAARPTRGHRRARRERRTALMLATLSGQARAVDLLLAHGADPNAADAQGVTTSAGGHCRRPARHRGGAAARRRSNSNGDFYGRRQAFERRRECRSLC